ncbi:MAG: heavy-metal-associated domain-containing protein, partial [Flavobacteriaceae bacterium]
MTETTYRIEGMTCIGCVKGVEQKLMNVEQIHAVAVDLQSGEAKITTADSEVPLSSLQETLGSKYHISA